MAAGDELPGTRCEAVHPGLKVRCQLVAGRATAHMAQVGKRRIVWPEGGAGLIPARIPWAPTFPDDEAARPGRR